MEEHLKDLNKTLNNMISTEDRFTEKQRQNIRERIAKKRSGRFSLIQSNWKPIMSTAVTLILLFAIAQIMFDNLNLSSTGDNTSSSEGAESSQLSKGEAHLESSGNDAASGDAPAVAESTLDKATDLEQSPPLDRAAPDAVVQKPALPLDDDLQAAYEHLKSSQSQEALSDLGAFEVMQLYFHATEIEDYETQYMMFYQDPAGVMVSKQMYIDDLADRPEVKEGNARFLQELVQVERFEITYRLDATNRQEAYITWGGTGEHMKFFRLIRDQQKDIWTVSFVPMQ